MVVTPLSVYSIGEFKDNKLVYYTRYNVAIRFTSSDHNLKGR